MRSEALNFWDYRPYLPTQVKEKVDESVQDWMKDPELNVEMCEPCLRKALEDAYLKAYESEEDDDLELEQEEINRIYAIAKIDSTMYSLIEKGLLEGYETETGELMIWFTELGVKAFEILKEEDGNRN